MNTKQIIIHALRLQAFEYHWRHIEHALEGELPEPVHIDPVLV